MPGKTLTLELCSAMKCIESCGVTSPKDYHQTLVEKYTREGVRYSLSA
jgi:hypothetical protein